MLSILITLLALIGLGMGHEQKYVTGDVQKFLEAQEQRFNPQVFTFRSADRSMIRMALDSKKENLFINATVALDHYLLLYFLGYSQGTEEAPKLFSDRVKDKGSPDYEKGMTKVLVWQSDDDWSRCGEATHIEGAETAVIDRESKIKCTIYADDPDVPKHYTSFSLKRPVVWEELEENQSQESNNANIVSVIEADASLDYFHLKPGDRMHFLFAFETLTYKLDRINREDYQGRFWISIDRETGEITHSPVVHFQGDFWKTHGWACWLAWSFFSLAIVYTQRFGAVYWRNSLAVHITLGVLSITLTLYFTAAGLVKAGYVKPQTHAYIGLVMCCIVWMEGVTGFYAYRTGQVQKWNSRSVVISKRVHKVFGYSLIAVAQYETQIGIVQYEEEWGLQPVPYGYINAIFMFISVLLMEIHFRVRRAQQDKFKDPDVIMSIEEFQVRIKKGEKLAIIDDLVIDISQYLYHHPGGRFTLERNIGRDMSKFFYGGYSLENMNANPQKPYCHTNIARIIVNELIVARLHEQASVALCRIGDEFTDIRQVNRHTRTFTFRTYSNEHNWKNYFLDLTYIGKHYLVSPIDKPKLKRHYTVSNCMRRQAYTEILRVANKYIEAKANIRPHELGFDWNILSQKDMNEVTLTIKNYSIPTGLSPQFFFTDKVYEIKGPMGKGLEIKDSGTHVAFTAGTGILVFIDIVAHLILQALQIIEYDTGSDNSENYNKDDENEKIDPEVVKFLLDFAGTFENVQGPIVEQVEKLKEERKRQELKELLEKERQERERRDQAKREEEEKKRKAAEEKKNRRRKMLQDKLDNSSILRNYEGGEEEKDTDAVQESKVNETGPQKPAQNDDDEELLNEELKLIEEEDQLQTKRGGEDVTQNISNIADETNIDIHNDKQDQPLLEGAAATEEQTDPLAGKEIRKDVPAKKNPFPSPFFQAQSKQISSVAKKVAKQNSESNFQGNKKDDDTDQDSILNQIKNLGGGVSIDQSEGFLEDDDGSMTPVSGGNAGGKVIMEEPDFKFVLYCSFMSQKESVGLELCEKLVQINKLAGLNNFELNVRFSYDDGGNRVKRQHRWDQTFIKDSLTRITKVNQERLVKVWACGPPLMNEVFDKALEHLMPQFGLSMQDYEVM